MSSVRPRAVALALILLQTDDETNDGCGIRQNDPDQDGAGRRILFLSALEPYAGEVSTGNDPSADHH
jgi:hypothetical protein